MLPGHIDSDDDLETDSHAELAGRWSLLVDLRAEFGGAFGAYLIFAVLLPGALVAYGMWGSPDDPASLLLGAAVIFIVCLSISLYTCVWFVWAKRREEKTFAMMQRRGEEEYERAERLAQEKMVRQK